MSKKYLIVLFTMTTLIVTLFGNSLMNIYTSFYLMNPLCNKSTKSLTFESEDIHKITNQLDKYHNTALYIDEINLDICFGEAIYFNNYKFNIPLINGRFISENDLKDNRTKNIVIGKNLRQYIIRIDNQDCIKIDDIYYKVIGVMGYNDRTSYLDSTFFINLNGYMNNKIIQKNIKFKITTPYLNNVISDLKSNAKNVSYAESSDKGLVENVLINGKSMLLITGIMVLIFILNIINIISYYIKSKIKEIGIRRNYGAGNFNIFLNVLCDYFEVITYAVILSSVIYILIIKSNLSSSLFGYDVFLLPILISYSISIIIGCFISMIVVRKSNKYPINNLIKGV